MKINLIKPDHLLSILDQINNIQITIEKSQTRNDAHFNSHADECPGKFRPRMLPMFLNFLFFYLLSSLSLNIADKTCISVF